MRMWGLDPKDSDRANPHGQLIPELCWPGQSPDKAWLRCLQSGQLMCSDSTQESCKWAQTTRAHPLNGMELLPALVLCHLVMSPC